MGTQRLITIMLDFFVDFDECEANVDGCAQICRNVNGSYNCDCYFGFSLNDDRKACLKGNDMNIYRHLITIIV
jgi:hypothetical protein